MLEAKGPLARDCVAVAAAYAIAGRLALALSLAPGYASAVWPPAGIAAAAVLLRGARIWPGIAVGSFLANAAAGMDASSAGSLGRTLLIAALLSTGATIQALLAGELAARLVREPARFETRRDVILLLVVTGPVACLWSATWGVATLAAAGVVSGDLAALSWFTWWVGDSIGVFLFMPPLLVVLGPAAAARGARAAAVALPLLVVGPVVTGFYVRAASWEHQQQRLSMERLVLPALQAVRSDVERHVDAVSVLARALRDVPPGDRARMGELMAETRHLNPGLTSLEWILRVTPEDHASVDRFPVDHLEPREHAARAVGIDLAGDASRLEIFRRADSSGTALLSRPLELLERLDLEPAVTVNAPVYRSQHGAGPRRSGAPALSGFVVGVLDVERLLERARPQQILETLVLEARDTTNERAPLVLSRPATPAPALHELTSLSFPAGGQKWTIAAALPEAALVKLRSWEAWCLLAAGLLFTSLLGPLLLCFGKRAEALIDVDGTIREALARTSSDEACFRVVATRTSGDWAIRIERES